MAERTRRGEFIIKAIKAAGPPRKIARRDLRVLEFKVSKALDERMMELERKVDLMRTGGGLWQPIRNQQPEAGEQRYVFPDAVLRHLGERTVHPGRIVSTMDSLRESQAPRQPTPYKLDGPLQRGRMTLKPTDPATLNVERGRTILTRFGLDPDKED